MKQDSLAHRVAAFIQALDHDELSFIYLGGARLWLDSGSGGLAITYGPPDDEAGHDVKDVTPLGLWVYTPLQPSLADEHPRSPTGDIDFDWHGMAAWERRWLLNCVHQIAGSLEQAAERAFDAFAQTRTLLATFPRQGMNLS